MIYDSTQNTNSLRVSYEYIKGNKNQIRIAYLGLGTVGQQPIIKIRWKCLAKGQDLYLNAITCLTKFFLLKIPSAF
mgnify:CR=1 FL=1